MTDSQEPKMRKVQPQRIDPTKPWPSSMGEQKIQKVYPKITIPLKDLPEARTWKIEETYELELELRMVGIIENEYEKSVTFEIREIGVESEAGEPDEEDDN